MDLKITTNAAQKLHTCLGIPDERSDELSALMDDMFVTYERKRLDYNTADAMQKIAAISNNLEEYTYCMTTHFHWLSLVAGVSIGPPDSNIDKSWRTKNQA